MRKWKIFILLLCTAILTGACTKKESSDKKVLTVCTEESMEQTVMQLGEYLNRTEQTDILIKTIVIPVESQERESACKRLKTSLMAGKGADIYILTEQDRMSLEENGGMLFEDANKIVYNGVFADLTEFVRKDEVVADCFRPVMDAGKVNGRQYIVPFSFNAQIWEADEADSASDELRLDDALIPLMELLEKHPEKFSGIAPYELLMNPQCWNGKMIHYDKNQSDISEEEYREILNGIVKMAAKRGSKVQPVWECADAMYRGTKLRNEAREKRFVPTFTPTGKPLAKIISYGAIGRNCADKELAYKFLRLFLQKEYLTGEGFLMKSKYGTARIAGKSIYTDMGGVPVRLSALEEWIRGSLGSTGEDAGEVSDDVLKKNIQNFKEVIADIKEARFQNKLDFASIEAMDNFLKEDGYTYGVDFPDIDRRIDRAARDMYDLAYYTALE